LISDAFLIDREKQQLGVRWFKITLPLDLLAWRGLARVDR
jgi:hypothetical protein